MFKIVLKDACLNLRKFFKIFNFSNFAREVDSFLIESFFFVELFIIVLKMYFKRLNLKNE